MLTPADSFELRRGYDLESWNLLRRDSDVRVDIDRVTVLRGFLEKRSSEAREGTMTVSGRDRAGRLADEAAPSVHFSGMNLVQAFQRLASPWFSRITLSDARNRRIRVGHGKRVAGGAEPVVTINVRVPRRGNVHPGERRSQVMHEIADRAGLIWWSSADGEEIFLGKPNSEQDPTFTFVRGTPGVLDLRVDEDDGDRYSVIMCGGVGGATPDDYGHNVTDRRGVVYDNPSNKVDGTGRDFIHPKRMFLPEKQFDSFGDAQRVARNDQIRRDYKRHVVTVEAPFHGQRQTAGGPLALFAFNTVARVIDKVRQIDDTYLILDCAFSSNRLQGETTTMHMVPTGTEILL